MKKFRTILLWTVFILLAVLLTAGGAAGIRYWMAVRSAEKAELVSGPAVEPPSDSIPLGRKFQYRILFRVPWGVRPVSLTAESAAGSQLTAEPSFSLYKYGWGGSLWQGIIPVQCFRTGEIPAAQGQATFSNMQSFALTLPAVRSVFPPLNGDQLELAGELEKGKEPLSWKIIPAVAAVLLIVLAAVLLILKYLLRSRIHTVSPWEKALGAIRELLGQVRSGTAAPENSIAGLTDIVREYMERRFSLRAERQTTAEFMADLEQGKGNLETRHRDFLRSFLNAADLVKFARVPADRTLFENAAVKAEELIRETVPETSGKEKSK